MSPQDVLKQFQLPARLKWLERWLDPDRDKSALSRLIIICSMVILAFILVFPYCVVDNDVIRDHRSVHDVYADRMLEVVDLSQTKQKQLEAAESVEPVYRSVPGASRIITDKVISELEDIQDVRDDRRLSLAQKQERLKEILNGLDDDSFKVVWAVILQDRHWRQLYAATLETLDNLLKKGVTAEDIRVRKAELIQAYVPKAYQSNLQSNLARQKAITAIIKQKLRPTSTIDEGLTEEARKEAVEHVKPVMRIYTKGDLIVREGERVTPFQMAALQKQGLLMNDNRFLHVLGVCLLTMSLTFTIWGYIYIFERKTFYKPSFVSLINTLLVITLGGLVFWKATFPGYVYLYPMPIFAFMLTIFTNPRLALSITMIVLLIGGLTLQIPLETLSILTLSCVAGIMFLIRHPIPKNRLDILNAGLCVGIIQALSLGMISLIYEPTIDPLKLLINGAYGVGSGVFSGMITLGALPMIEKWFKLITPFTLLELSNQDAPILKRMQLEAPGTYHHSLIIATLAEAACEAIGANGLLARVGSYYHDIGKMRRPLFFIENQAYFGADNPHDKLSCRLSKMIVITHPRDGIEMGRQIGLPEQIIAFMPEHHGTLLAGYFYNKAVLEEGEENVVKEEFRYPGPKPQSRETAIVMLADACESAVRALRSPTQAQLEERIDKIFKQRIDDNQFSESPITFREIQIVRDTFVRVLRAMQHNRIEYQQQSVMRDFGPRTVVSEKPNVIDISTVQAKAP